MSCLPCWRRSGILAPVFWSLALWLGGFAAAEQLPVRTYDIHDGLASDSVTQIFQDSRGYLWFATRDGASRFDGEHFRSYGVEDGLPHERIHALLETRDGVYWIATQGGLAQFDPRHVSAGPAFTRVILGDMVTRGPVYSLFEDRAGRLWIGGAGRVTVLERRGGNRTMRQVDLGAFARSSHRVKAFAETPDGSVWVGTRGGLLRLLADGRTVRYPVMPHYGEDVVQGLEVDAAGRLWIAHLMGALVLWPEPPEALGRGPGPPLVERAREAGALPAADTGALRLPKAPGEICALTSPERTGVYQIHRVRDGRMWLAMNEGLALWNGRRLATWGVENGLGEKTLTAVAEDRDGNLWVGTESGGALRIARHGFVSFTAADGLADAPVRSLFEGRDGAVYAASGSSFDERLFLQRLGGGRFTAVLPRMPPGQPYLGWGEQQTALRDRSGQWWLATGRGLLRYPATARFEDLATTAPAVFNARNGLGGNVVVRLYEDTRGDLWVGTNGVRALSRWRRSTDRFQSYGPEDGIPPGELSAFAEDRAGQLWIGFSEHGLVRRRGERFERFGAAQGGPAGFIQSLYVDRVGRLWVAMADGGVARADAPARAVPRFVRYTTREGLASNDVRCLTEDAWGRLYLGTRKGIDRLDPATGRIEHFTTADGLAGNVVDVAMRDRGRTLWFGTRRGLSQLVPVRSPPSSAPAAWITAVRLEGMPQAVPELGAPSVSGLELDAGKRLEIEFLALSFAPGEELRYQHKLEGVDQDWSPPTTVRSVQYARLPGRQLRFLVRAVTRDGAVSPAPAELSFVVHPPLWRRWWVVAFAIGVASAAAVGLYRYRVTHLLAVERMRTSIATDLHDDMGSSLSRISILSEVARRRVEKDAESARLLNEIGESARDMMGALSESIWAIDPRRDDLRSFVTRLRLFAGDLLEGRGIAWQLRAPQDGELVPLSPVQRRQLFLIAKEALHNVARHSGAASVSMQLAVTGRRITLEIRDDGRGFDPYSSGDGRHGLRSMMSRAEALGARLDLESAPGQGTRLFLDAPIVPRNA
ncbi:MAG TPA: two-component regulator propeller domain-containing protein [Thermoanaerobaculia bacterium]